MITELEEVELNYLGQNLEQYRKQLQEKLFHGEHFIIMEAEHLDMQIRYAAPRKERFWNDRKNILLEIVERNYPELLEEVKG